MTDLTAQDEGASAPRPRRKFTTKLTHPTFSVEWCPREECGFPEAEGGYCPECGWMRPIPSCPHCQREGR